jgi:hypothetical protein
MMIVKRRCGAGSRLFSRFHGDPLRSGGNKSGSIRV